MTGYAEIYQRSLQRPEEFWAEAAEAIDWERRWDRVLDDSNPPFYRWFPGRGSTPVGTRSTAMSRRGMASGSR